MRLGSSFRDPAGYVFRDRDVLRRRVNDPGLTSYDALMRSGLYAELTGEGLLVRHQEVVRAESHLVIEPERVPFISYPYEWSFSQLKDAALLTLDIQRCALERSITLKDASAYNVQFVGGRPIFIDTLSFEPYADGSPWLAYGQFCRHFLAPLLLMSRVDVRLGGLLRVHLDGIPLDLASRLLPRSTLAKPGILLHVHAHARSIQRHADTRSDAAPSTPVVSRAGLLGLIESLERLVTSIRWDPCGTEWADYEMDNDYQPEADEAKRNLVRKFLAQTSPRIVWDLGANAGTYSRIAASVADLVVAFDVDPAAVERNYLAVKEDGPEQILPLLQDLMNPSPGAGWHNQERASWLDRGRPDVVLALALIHHLAIANNVPLPMVASTLAELAPTLVVEFVPKEDRQVQRLLRSRTDIFPDYTEAEFVSAFGHYFEIVDSERLPSSVRSLYLMRRATR